VHEDNTGRLGPGWRDVQGVPPSVPATAGRGADDLANGARIIHRPVLRAVSAGSDNASYVNQRRALGSHIVGIQQESPSRPSLLRDSAWNATGAVSLERHSLSAETAHGQPQRPRKLEGPVVLITEKVIGLAKPTRDSASGASGLRDLRGTPSARMSGLPDSGVEPRRRALLERHSLSGQTAHASPQRPRKLEVPEVLITGKR